MITFIHMHCSFHKTSCDLESEAESLLNHRDYGGKTRFSGRAVTISCHETNQVLRDVGAPTLARDQELKGPRSSSSSSSITLDTLSLLMLNIQKGVSLLQR